MIVNLQDRRPTILARVAAGEVREALSEFQLGPEPQEPFRLLTEPFRLLKGYRPGYWGPEHDRLAAKAARELFISYEDADRYLTAFFVAWPEKKETGEPLVRTDEWSCWGPSIEMVLRTAKAAGGHWEDGMRR